MATGAADDYPTAYEECLQRLETLHWKFDLPGDVAVRLDDILEQGRTQQDRERTAERLGRLLMYTADRHPEYDRFISLRDFLNNVMAALYGNDATSCEYE